MEKKENPLYILWILMDMPNLLCNFMAWIPGFLRNWF